MHVHIGNEENETILSYIKDKPCKILKFIEARIHSNKGPIRQ